MNNLRQRINYRMLSAIEKGDDYMVKKIISKYGLSYCLNWRDGYELLCEATENIQEKICEILIMNNAKINVKLNIDDSNCLFSMPLINAVSFKNIKMIKMLLNSGADINPQCKCCYSKSPIMTCIRRNDVDIIEFLINYFRENDDKRLQKFLNCTLASAIICNKIEIVKILLDKGADVDNNDKNLTPIHYAVKSRNEIYIELLLNYGGNINLRTHKCNDTPLLFAVKNMSTSNIIKIILENNANINFFDDNNHTALYYVIDNLNTTLPYHHLQSRIRRTLKLIVKHLVKRKRKNLYVCKENLNLLDTNVHCKNYAEKCEQEISILMTCKINNTNISLFDILTGSTQDLITFAKNDNVRVPENCQVFKTKYRIYGSILIRCLHKGLNMKTLLEQSIQVFERKFTAILFKLPFDVIEHIFKYFSKRELENFLSINEHTDD